MPSRSIEEPPSIQVTFANGQQDDLHPNKVIRCTFKHVWQHVGNRIAAGRH